MAFKNGDFYCDKDGHKIPENSRPCHKGDGAKETEPYYHITDVLAEAEEKQLAAPIPDDFYPDIARDVWTPGKAKDDYRVKHGYKPVNGGK